MDPHCLPKENKKDLTGDIGINELKELLNSNHIRHFEVPRGADFGVDIIAYIPLRGYKDFSNIGGIPKGLSKIQLFRLEQDYIKRRSKKSDDIFYAVTGVLILFQVKTSEKMGDGDCWTVDGIESKNIYHWSTSQNPVVLIACDARSGKLKYKIFNRNEFNGRKISKKNQIKFTDDLTSCSLNHLLDKFQRIIAEEKAKSSIKDIYSNDAKERVRAMRTSWLLVDDVNAMVVIANAIPCLHANVREGAIEIVGTAVADRVRFVAINSKEETADPLLFKKIDKEIKKIKSVVSSYSLESWSRVICFFEPIKLFCIEQRSLALKSKADIPVACDPWSDANELDHSLYWSERMRESKLSSVESLLDPVVAFLKIVNNSDVIVIRLLDSIEKGVRYKDLKDKNAEWWEHLYRSTIIDKYSTDQIDRKMSIIRVRLKKIFQ